MLLEGRIHREWVPFLYFDLNHASRTLAHENAGPRFRMPGVP